MNILADVFSLASRDIWVFGGAGYLGQPTVALLSRVGARVLCVDLADRTRRCTRRP